MPAANKAIERRYVENLCRLLGFDWRLSESEVPDFIIDNKNGRFGLEVTQAFLGEKTSAGSALAKNESDSRRWLSSILKKTDNLGDSKLKLQFLGHKIKDGTKEIVSFLTHENFQERQIGYRAFADLNAGKVWATKEFHNQVEFMRDIVGWVSPDPSPFQSAIDQKSRRLEAYRLVVPEVALLVAMDRRNNSGKVAIPEEFAPDLKGFDAVYLITDPIYAAAYYSDGSKQLPIPPL